MLTSSVDFSLPKVWRLVSTVCDQMLFSVGIPEDPVTGSAHCALMPYWSKVLNSDKLTALQCSARGGLLKLELAGDRVKLTGRAETTLTGMVNLPSTAAGFRSKL